MTPAVQETFCFNSNKFFTLAHPSTDQKFASDVKKAWMLPNRLIVMLWSKIFTFKKCDWIQKLIWHLGHASLAVLTQNIIYTYYSVLSKHSAVEWLLLQLIPCKAHRQHFQVILHWYKTYRYVYFIWLIWY